MLWLILYCNVNGHYNNNVLGKGRKKKKKSAFAVFLYAYFFPESSLYFSFELIFHLDFPAYLIWCHLSQTDFTL